MITTSPEVAGLCRGLASADFVAVDTEFVRERSYWPRLCLVQLAGPRDVAAIDPLAAGIDLAPLFDLLSDETVLKVFHAARQDLEIFFYLTGRVPRQVFDTQLAASVCGFGDQVGYPEIAARLAGARIDKLNQVTDWERRPLAPAQIDYALADVTHLRTVYGELRKKLRANGRESWIEGDLALLTRPETYSVDVREAWRRIKVRGRKPRVLAVLRELAAWREETARSRDLPRQRILKDDVLARLALARPATAQDLERMRLLPRGLAGGRYGPAILAAVARGLELPERELPRDARGHGPGRRAPPAALVGLLKLLLQVRCESEGVAPRLVAATDEIERFADTEPDDSPLCRGWRYDLFGRDAERLKRGELALASDGDGSLRLVELRSRSAGGAPASADGRGAR